MHNNGYTVCISPRIPVFYDSRKCVLDSGEFKSATALPCQAIPVDCGGYYRLHKTAQSSLLGSGWPLTGIPFEEPLHPCTSRASELHRPATTRAANETQPGTPLTLIAPVSLEAPRQTGCIPDLGTIAASTQGGDEHI